MIIETNIPQLILIRGIPGSGKSTLAKILKENFGFDWYEADMWFYNTLGKYEWTPERAKLAHDWCFESFKKSIDNGKNVVVSNTFVTKYSMERYIEYAQFNGYKFTILRANGNYKNIHNVPEDTMKRMIEKFEP